MMHENIYNVKFSDGRKKCYIAKDTYYSEEDEDEVRNIVDLETGLGVRAHVDYLEIDEENKEANYPFNIVCLSVEDLQYNYFQNSNLSAWKVWYCLDNDTARFAWAKDTEDLASILISNAGLYGVPFYRNIERDETQSNTKYYCWRTSEYGGINYYTLTETPTTSDALYTKSPGSGNMLVTQDTITSVTPASPVGTGVIYRLVDEWNNDVPYDFKNIQYRRTVNAYNKPDPQAVVVQYFYTFSLINNDNNYEILDASIFAKDFLNDENAEGTCSSNYISSIDAYTANLSMINKFTLSNIILVVGVTQYDHVSFINHNTFECCYNITLLGNKDNLTIINSYNIIDEDFLDMNTVIVLNVWNRIITGAWTHNIVKLDSNILQKVSFVNL